MAHLDIANRLAIYGYKQELEDFDAVLAALWWADYEPVHRTVEMMLHYPYCALSFCDSVRNRIELPELENSEVLLRLTNIRKSGYLNASKPKND
jgi:hypothetical protein